MIHKILFFRIVVSIALVLGYHAAIGQPKALISAYYDNALQSEEWVEVLVVADNTSLVGHHVADFNGTQSTRVGGVTFNNHTLWQHLREGTIIMILCGDYSTEHFADTTIADGFVQISKNDKRYFTSYMNAVNGLSINAAADYVQILLPDATPIHGLGHGYGGGQGPGTGYITSPDPKILADVPSISGNVVNVVARSLAGYNAGITKDSVSITTFSVSDYQQYETGLPNLTNLASQQAGIFSRNHLFWRELREPKWEKSPTVTVELTVFGALMISWTSPLDPYPIDNTTGVIIVRDSLGFSQFPANAIVDGSKYSVGDKLGTATIVGIVPVAAGLGLHDSSTVCGATYTYRAYAYRYAPDDIRPLSRTQDFTARGCQVNERLYGESQPYQRESISTPTFTASRELVCAGDTVQLKTTTLADRYEWLLNGVPVLGATASTVTVRGTGTYQLRTYGKGGCSATSAPTRIYAIPSERVDIHPRGVIELCFGDSLRFSTQTPASSYQWYRNGIAIPSATSKNYVASTPGTYNVAVPQDDGCLRYSAGVNVTVADVKISASVARVDFGVVEGCGAQAEQSFDLMNTGSHQLFVTSATFTAGFGMVSPETGFRLLPGEKQRVVLRYTPMANGITTGAANFSVLPCSTGVSIQLRGEATERTLTINRSSVDFGVFRTCDTTSSINVDSTIVFVNTGTDSVYISAPAVTAPFTVVMPGTIAIGSGSSLSVRINYKPNGANLDRQIAQTIEFPFTTGSSQCSGTLKTTLRAAAFKPRIEFIPNTIKVKDFLTCDEAILDTFLVVRNSRPVVADIDNASGLQIGMPDLPISLAAGSIASFAIDARLPQTPGNFNTSAQIFVLPCRSIQEVVITGNMRDAEINVQPSSLVFEESSSCQPQATEQAFTIVTNGLAGGVRNLHVNEPFEVFADSLLFLNSVRCVVRLKSTAPGVYSDTVSLIVEPCNREFKIPVAATVNSVGYTMVCGCDVGTIGIGQQKVDSVVLRNTSTSILDVKAPSGITAPFSLVSTSPALPGKIAPGDSLIIRYAYSYAGKDRRDSVNMSIGVQFDTCNTTVTRMLYGATRDSIPVDTTTTPEGLVLTLVENIPVTPGRTFSIPVALICNTVIARTKVTTLTAKLHYNASMMRVTGATSSQPNVFAVQATETVPGTSSIVVSSTTEIPLGTPLFTIDAMGYLGNDTTSVLDFDEVVSDYREISDSAGSIQVLTDCAIQPKSIGFGSPVSIAVHSASVDGIEARIGIRTDDNVKVAIFDLEGREATTVLEGHVRPGVYQLHIDTSQLPSGTYLLTLINGSGVSTVLLPNVR